MNLLIGLHAGLGEAGALAFLWVFIEMLNPSERRLYRARLVAFLGILFLIGAWIVGGYYYVVEYGSLVKPIIKEGPLPWAHSVITETKEHLFLFLPFLAIFVWGVLRRYKNEFIENRNLRMRVLVVSILIFLLAFAMAGMGVIIASGFRAALEAKVI